MLLILSALCAISANLDTLTVSIAFGIKNVKISLSASIVIGLITSLGTWASMAFGVLIANRINFSLLNWIGAIILMGVGLWIAYEGIRDLSQENSPSMVLSRAENADTDQSGVIDFKESFVLALALTVNNLGVGVAAGVAELSIWMTTIFTFLFTFLFMWMGSAFGKSVFAHWLGKYAELISGCVIFLVGLASGLI
ncbi:MAG: manganese efflux pump [Eubacteriaceae bacterium]|nr:manganese efflux pump [Eubacteriaceae bacterium]